MNMLTWYLALLGPGNAIVANYKNRTNSSLLLIIILGYIN